MGENNIRIDRLSVGFRTSHETATAVHEVSLVLRGDRITGVIGETGCGKSVLGMSIPQLLPRNTRIRGRIYYHGEDILSFTGRSLRRLRSAHMAFIPQNPDTSLNPIMTAQTQIREAMAAGGNGGRNLTARLNELLGALGLNGVGGLGSFYPFQLSGGMKQRVLTALGVCRNPRWVLADEPTKGLDASLRSEVCALLADIHARTGAGMMIITHDLPLAKRLCRDIAVMYCGEVVETAPAGAFFSSPAHPYARALLAALPRGGFVPIPGETPSMVTPPAGCRFHPRCEARKEICTVTPPPPYPAGPHREVRCHLYA